MALFLKRNPLKVSALTKEWLSVWYKVLEESGMRFPQRMLTMIMRDSSLLGSVNQNRIGELVGASLLDLFNELGPIYGKFAQMSLSRLPASLHEYADKMQITRLYSDWPAIPFKEVEEILDREVPHWRTLVKHIETKPLGVASMAQVHRLTTFDETQWAIKILKPKAKSRLLESLAALDELHEKLSVVMVSATGRHFLAELQELIDGFRREINLEQEAQTIERVRALLKEKKQEGVLRIPRVYAALSQGSVICMEYFHGTQLSEVVAGRTNLNEAQRRRLAKNLLRELLIQVFELGLFHADPHAGNLILLEDGSLGLFDWGLAGELSDSDRLHIAALLRAAMVFDLDKIASALVDIAKDSNITVDHAKVRKELDRLLQLVKTSQEKEVSKSSKEEPEKDQRFHVLMQECLKVANRLRIPIPTGLLMMVKSLVTIEGLARGIDPKISLKLVAAPVLLRVAKPSFADLLSLGKKLPLFFFKKNNS